jgi:hypothetical protein
MASYGVSMDLEPLQLLEDLSMTYVVVDARLCR